MMDDPKVALRRTLRQRRRLFVDGLGDQQRSALEGRLALPLRSLWRPGLKVVGYFPKGAEASPLPCLHDACRAGARTGLGWIGADPDSMEFRAWAPGAPLSIGPMSVQQPLTGAEQIAPDMILTPLLAFDRMGNRLGQGGGYYDRIFARYPGALRIGIAWSIQQCESVPVDPWDQPLHIIATETGLIGELPA